MDKESLVLLPGHLCDEWAWASVIDLIKPTVPNSLVITLGPQDSIAALADAVEAKLPSGKIALAGFSLGGMVALELVRRNPDKISRLALIGTTAREAEAMERSALTANHARFKSGEAEGLIRDFVTFLSAPAVVENNPDLVAATLKMMMRNVACFEAQQQAIMNRPDHLSVLGKINCPTTVIYGALDLIAPPEIHEEMAKSIAHSSLVQIPDAGHMVLSEKPNLVANAIRSWLNQ